MASIAPPPGPEITDPRLRQAAESGLISVETARAIEALEIDARPPSRVMPLVAEALGFVGAVLALVAAVLLVSQFWAELRPWARVAIPAVIAVAFFAAGGAVRSRETGAVARLASFLWFLSAGALAVAAGLLGSDVLELRGPQTFLLLGSLATPYAAALWYVRRRMLQHAALFAGVVVTAVAALAVVEQSLMDYAGFLVWVVGVAWLLLAWAGVVTPGVVGYALGGLAAVIGPSAVGWPVQTSGMLLGAATAVALVTASVVIRRTVLLWLGVLALFIYVPRIVFEFFGETLGAPLALFISGAALVGLALLLARLHSAGTLPTSKEAGL